MRVGRTLTAAVLASSALAPPALAQETPVGNWKIVDEVSGKTRAIIRIAESNAVLSGRIEKLFLKPAQEQNPRCIACSDARKDQPIMGMTILTGLKREDHSMTWIGGEILDAEDGKTYKIKTTVIDGGRKLEVRGYIGVPLLGRTQTWLREP